MTHPLPAFSPISSSIDTPPTPKPASLLPPDNLPRPPACLWGPPLPSFILTHRKIRTSNSSTITGTGSTYLVRLCLSSPSPSTSTASIPMNRLLPHCLLATLYIWLSSVGHGEEITRRVPQCWQSCLPDTSSRCQHLSASPALLNCKTSLSHRQHIFDSHESAGLCSHSSSSALASLLSCARHECTDSTTFPPLIEEISKLCIESSPTIPEGEPQNAEGLADFAASDTSTFHLELRDTRENSSETASASSSGTAKKPDSSESSDGSPLDVANQANKKKARSLLGLTVCLVAGVAWF